MQKTDAKICRRFTPRRCRHEPAADFPYRLPLQSSPPISSSRRTVPLSAANPSAPTPAPATSAATATTSPFTSNSPLENDSPAPLLRSPVLDGSCPRRGTRSSAADFPPVRRGVSPLFDMLQRFLCLAVYPPQRPQYQVERCFLPSLVLLALRVMRNTRWERRRHRQKSLRVLVLWRNCSFFG